MDPNLSVVDGNVDPRDGAVVTGVGVAGDLHWPRVEGGVVVGGEDVGVEGDRGQWRICPVIDYATKYCGDAGRGRPKPRNHSS